MDVCRTLLVSIWLSCPGRPLPAAGRPLLVCYGDSITAGYGLSPASPFPTPCNAISIPAATTTRSQSGNQRRHHQGRRRRSALHTASASCKSSIVEFGGNDGLRGLPLDQTRRNLDQVLTTLENAHIRVLLAGITLPPNYGPDYIQSIRSDLPRLSPHKHHVAFVPMIYKDLVHVPGTIQPDGIHPTAKGSEIIAQHPAAGTQAFPRKKVTADANSLLPDPMLLTPSPQPAETAFPQPLRNPHQLPLSRKHLHQRRL